MPFFNQPSVILYKVRLARVRCEITPPIQGGISRPSPRHNTYICTSCFREPKTCLPNVSKATFGSNPAGTLTFNAIQDPYGVGDIYIHMNIYLY